MLETKLKKQIRIWKSYIDGHGQVIKFAELAVTIAVVSVQKIIHALDGMTIVHIGVHSRYMFQGPVTWPYPDFPAFKIILKKGGFLI